jgi:hypothetical protein
VIAERHQLAVDEPLILGEIGAVAWAVARLID